MMGIQEIPSEVTEMCLVYSHPRDVTAFARTSRTFYKLVYGAADSHLWRLLWFAQGFGDPLSAIGVLDDSDKFDWRRELLRRTRAEWVASKEFTSATPNLRLEALETLLEALSTIPPDPTATTLSYTDQWVQSLVQQAGLHNRPTVDLGLGDTVRDDLTVYRYATDAGSMEMELRHRLHAYLGLSTHERSTEVACTNRMEARCFVYDLRNCTKSNSYGPLLPQQRDAINWRYVDHILEVIARNLDDRALPWPEKIYPPWGLRAIRAYSAPGTWDRRKRDWAGVEGRWQRVVCFMDYP